MQGSITVRAEDKTGITISGFVTMDPSSYSERRTIREMLEYLLDYVPKTTEEPNKEEEA